MTADLARPAGHQLHQVAVMLTNLVTELADTASGGLRDNALTAVTAARNIIDQHETPLPDLNDLARELRRSIATLDSKVTAKANEIAGPTIEAVQADADHRVRNARLAHETDRNRWDDLEREMRRQMFAMEKGRALYGNALIDVLEGLEKVEGSDDFGALQDAVHAARMAAWCIAPRRRIAVPDRPDITTRERASREAPTGKETPL